MTEDDTIAAEQILPSQGKLIKGQVPALAASASGELPQE